MIKESVSEQLELGNIPTRKTIMSTATGHLQGSLGWTIGN